MSVDLRVLVFRCATVVAFIAVFYSPHVSLEGKKENTYCPGLIGSQEFFPILDKETPQSNLPLNLPNYSNNSNCSFNWTNKDHIKEKFRDRIQKGEKQLFRLRVPVTFNDGVPYNVTVVWVTAENQYMLHFPQNFQTLSLGTTVIISENLRHDHISGNCSSNCSQCGLGRKELSVLLSELTINETQYNWEYLCIPASYGTNDIMDEYPETSSDLYSLNSRHLALPDVLYYFYFFKTLFTQRQFFGIPSYEKDFPNYYCYNETGGCVVKELLMKYYILMHTAIVTWLYSPLLVFYLPSSVSIRGGKSTGKQEKMIPTHKSPVHFTRFIMQLLGYHLRENSEGAWWKIRLRRLLILIFIFLMSFRLFLLSRFWLISCSVLLVVSIALFAPLYISKNIKPEKPSYFPLFPNCPYPKGMIKWSSETNHSVEFQRLAYVMQERVWLVLFHCEFWKFIFSNSFSDCMSRNNRISTISILKTILSIIIGVVAFLVAFIIAVTYYLVPIPFFAKELLCSIVRGCKDYYEKHNTAMSLLLSSFQCLSMILLLVYILILMLALCILMTEFAMFTYIGAVMTPTMALKYVTLTAAFATTVVTMVRDLQKGYDEILKETVSNLQETKIYESFEKEVMNKKLNISLKKDDRGVHIYKKRSSESYCTLLLFDTFTPSVSEELYNHIVEQYQPLRRQVILVLVKMFLTVYFIGIAMWIKNVFHIERKVTDIFALASQFAVFFLPSLLEFLSYRGKFGKNAELVRKKEIYFVILNYLEHISGKI